MTAIKAGTRLRSVVSATEVMVTMGGEGVLTCGGEPMVPAASGDPVPEPSASPVDGETLLGKRYRVADGTFQVLCVRQGPGVLALDGAPLDLIRPKLLPASD